MRLYLRDVYDHSMQVSEVAESYREVAADLTNMYLSVLSNRTNDVMKVLTIMASIFIPLSFLGAVYGMNFDHMPELHLRYAYPVFWVAIIAVAAFMLGFFYRRGWINPFGKRDKH